MRFFTFAFRSRWPVLKHGRGTKAALHLNCAMGYNTSYQVLPRFSASVAAAASGALLLVRVVISVGGEARAIKAALAASLVEVPYR